MKACTIIKSGIKKKATAQRIAAGWRKHGKKSRVGGKRGNYSVLDCGRRKTSKQKQQTRRRSRRR